MVSGWQILVILVIVLLLFGGRKIPELARGLGEGIKSFKKAVSEEDEKGRVIDAEIETPKQAQQPQQPVNPTQQAGTPTTSQEKRV